MAVSVPLKFPSPARSTTARLGSIERPAETEHSAEHMRPGCSQKRLAGSGYARISRPTDAPVPGFAMSYRLFRDAGAPRSRCEFSQNKRGKVR